ncbi:sensor domain-containing diguanylate cyclase [Aliikangiella coralliicola]|uniref:diguanylate cyclase n=1 Tax=Aliikangiella coralliicola TaxID=2592383 RepID=A0A545UCZ9_9GAMM|nr:diguanylate cyclase [Aliikangiella coralliicola]TQV87331.1 diguanylate cyclase [Aliikangiella coralliicola]
MKILKLIGILLTGCWIKVVLAVDYETKTLASETDATNLSNYVYFYQEASPLGLNEVVKLSHSQWKKNNTQNINFGYTDSSYWLRTSFYNSEEQTSAYFLEIAYPVLDFLDIYVINSDSQKHYQLGDKYPFNNRVVQHYNFLIPINVKSREQVTVFIRVKSTSALQVPLNLWPKEKFYDEDQFRSIILGVFLGIILVMGLYNLFVYYKIKDNNYLYYVLYVFSIGMFFCSLTGLSFQYLWPNNTVWNDHLIAVFLNFAILFGTFFSRKLLAIRRSHPQLDKVFSFAISAALVCLILCTLLPYQLLIRITIYLAVFVCLLGLVSGIIRLFDGYPLARYYTFAWAAVLVGGIILAANKFVLLPNNWFTEHAAMIGISFEVACLSIAIAERVMQERRMRFKAQNTLLHFHRRNSQELEKRVKERTEDLESLNRKLKEANNTDALTLINNRRYFEKAFKEEYARCRRFKHNLSVLMIDIDYFKKVNDNYGHQAGDACLTLVAQVLLQSAQRTSDFVARYGGEEFCVFAPETHADQGVTFAEKIRNNVEQMEFMFNEQIIPVTVSIGLCCEIPEGETYEEHLRQADEALYQAKTNGRNRVEMAKAKSIHNS